MCRVHRVYNELGQRHPATTDSVFVAYARNIYSRFMCAQLVRSFRGTFWYVCINVLYYISLYVYDVNLTHPLTRSHAQHIPQHIFISITFTAATKHYGHDGLSLRELIK